MKHFLEFTNKQCKGCGTVKPAGSVCNKCGLSATENDPLVEHRAIIVDGLRKSLEEEREKSYKPLDIVDEWQLIGDCFSNIRIVVESICKGNILQTQKLNKYFKELTEIEERINITPWHRPKLEIYRTAHEILENIKQFGYLICELLCSNSPEDADIVMIKMNVPIEKINELIDILNKRLCRWGKMPTAPHEDEVGGVEALAKTAFHDSGAINFLEYVLTGQKISKKIIDDESLSVLGAGLQMTEIQVELTMDPQRFWKTLRDLFDLFISKPVQFEKVFKSEEWIKDLHMITREMYEIGLESSSIVAIKGQRMDVKGYIGLGGKLVERVVPTLLAVVLCVIQNKDYETVTKKGSTKKKKNDPNTYINQIINTKFAHIMYGFDIELRDAESHGAFEIHENNIEFTSTQQKNYTTLTIDELQDRVLGAVESSLAIHAAIVSAATRMGFNVNEIDPLFLFKEEERVRVAMSMNGWSEVVVGFEGNSLIVSGVLQHKTNRENIFKSVSVILPYITEKCEHIKLKVVVRKNFFKKEYLVEGPTAPLRRWNNFADGIRKNCAFMEAWMSWNVGGSKTEKQRVIRKWVALQCDKILNNSTNDLPALEELACSIGDNELVSVIRCLIESTKSKNNKFPSNSDAQENINKLIKWGQTKTR